MDKIMQCKNPRCRRYYREMQGDGEYCCRKCRVETDFDFSQHDKKMQIIFEQEFENQSEGG